MILFNENVLEFKSQRGKLFYVFIDYVSFLIVTLFIIYGMWFQSFHFLLEIKILTASIILLEGIIFKKIYQKSTHLKEKLFLTYTLSCIVACFLFIFLIEKEFLFLPILALFFLLNMMSLMVHPKTFFSFGYYFIISYLFVICSKILIFQNFLYNSKEKFVFIIVPLILLAGFIFWGGSLIKSFIDQTEYLKTENEHLKDKVIEINSLNNEVKKINAIDFLTGALSKHAGLNILEKFVELAFKFKFKLTIILFDIHHLKEINQTKGTHAGDLILKDFSNIVKDHKKESDIICRYTGGSFLMILPRQNKKESLELVSSIENSIDIKFHFALTEINEITYTDNIKQMTNMILELTTVKLYTKKTKLKK